MFSKLFFTFAVVTITVTAQSTTATSSAANSTSTAVPDVSACVAACISGAAILNGCDSLADVKCICGSAQAQTDAVACLSDHCSSAELAAAVALQTSQCAHAGVTASGIPSAANSITFTLTDTSTGSGASNTRSAPTNSTSSAAATTPTSPTTAGTGAAPSDTSKSGAAAVIDMRGIAALIGTIIAGALSL